jgi:REP element-mobilizing transposase RayT
MPVYLITLHAYRSWRPDHPRGFVQRGKGIQPPNPELARAYDENAKHPPVVFDAAIQRLLIWGGKDICDRRGWRLHGAATEPTHVHYLVSWKEVQLTWREVRKRIKNVLSLMLGKFKGRKGGHWFVEDGSRKRVKDRAHFDYLVNEYLPKHRGLRWFEGEAEPQPPAGFEA